MMDDKYVLFNRILEVKVFTVYGLVDPSTHTIFYVGRTGRDVMVRLQEHLNEPHTFSLKHQRIEKIWSETVEPIRVVVLESGIYDEKTAFSKEVFWVQLLLNTGNQLTNASVDFDDKLFLRVDTLETEPTPKLPFPKDTNHQKQNSKENESYISASHSWERDILNTENEPTMVERYLEKMDGCFFQIEHYLPPHKLLKETCLTDEDIRIRRLKNIENGHLINRGMPITSLEEEKAKAFYEVNSDLDTLERYFQRSRLSLEKMIEI
ncbi:hypothetical protein [Vibrio vulnificus]|uniref:hypothetical protein n=1 Tax=Vibrio vulnificus TaxID=672 RepID=UPI0013EED827|nr:hypothetical protein [Vibrio vulnificus]